MVLETCSTVQLKRFGVLSWCFFRFLWSRLLHHGFFVLFILILCLSLFLGNQVWDWLGFVFCSSPSPSPSTSSASSSSTCTTTAGTGNLTCWFLFCVNITGNNGRILTTLFIRHLTTCLLQNFLGLMKTLVIVEKVWGLTWTSEWNELIISNQTNSNRKPGGYLR